MAILKASPMQQQQKKLSIVLPDHWAANFGGAEYQAKVLIGALLAHGGFEISYLARNVSRIFVPTGYTIKQVKTCRSLARYADFFDAPSLYTLLRSVRPDVIYQTVGCAYTGVAAYYSRNAGAKMVWQIASDIDVQPFGGGLSLNLPFRYVEKKLLEYGIRKTTQIIAQTRHQDEMLFQHYSRRADAVIPNFHPVLKDNVRKGNNIQVVWVANLKPLKRPEIFVRLARELHSKQNDVRFTMIGRGGDSDWHRDLLQQIARASYVEYLGELPQDEVNQVLAQAHVLVSTSAYEGFPNTFIQAWMRKVPVVSLQLDPDGVLGEQGIGFCPGTYERLRDHVALLIEDSDLRHRMGEKAQDHAFKHHSMKNAEKIIEILGR